MPALDHHLRNLIASASLGALCVACGGGDAISAPVGLPALESIPWDLTGIGKIAFERTGPTTTGGQSGFYVLDGRTRTSTPISSASLGMGTAISPDGSRLAFRLLTSFTTFWDIYVSDIDGGNRRQISAGPGNELNPSWSADGSRLMFHATGGLFGTTIYSLAANAAPSAGGAMRSVAAVGDGRFSQSADGVIVFSGRFAGSNGTIDGVLRMQSDGTGLTLLRAGNAISPTWSPDAQRIAYMEQVPGSVSVSVMNADGTGVVTLGAVPNISVGSWAFQDNALSLCWTADGLGIVFTAPEANFVSHVFAVPVAGGAIRRITSAEGVSDISVSCSR